MRQAIHLLQCDRACEGAEILQESGRKSWTPCFNVTAPVKARKLTHMERERDDMKTLQCDRACEGAEIPKNSWSAYRK